MTDHLSDDYWNQRYLDGAIGWDLGQISPPIRAYVDQLNNKELRILIPGAGNAHEAVYLHQQGFTDVHVLDFASDAIASFLKNNPDFPKGHAHVANFFDFEGEFDLIIEQTLFCAIDTLLRPNYARKASELLKMEGKLVGLLFNREFDGGPPFGGNKSEYLDYFVPYFESIFMEDCYNSIEPRSGSELFIRLVK